MSPLETPWGWLLVLGSVPAAVLIGIITERRHVVKRNRRARERGYVRTP